MKRQIKQIMHRLIALLLMLSFQTLVFANNKINQPNQFPAKKDSLELKNDFQESEQAEDSKFRKLDEENEEDYDSPLYLNIIYFLIYKYLDVQSELD